MTRCVYINRYNNYYVRINNVYIGTYSTEQEAIQARDAYDLMHPRKTGIPKKSPEQYTRHPLYNTWTNMMRRCRDSRIKQYKDYGGRGISVCSEWDDFWQFVEDIGTKPAGYSLDRIDNNLGYFKNNCRWASREEQSINTRKFKQHTTIWKETHPTKNYSRWRVRVRKKGTYTTKSFRTKEEAEIWVSLQTTSPTPA